MSWIRWKDMIVTSLVAVLTWGTHEAILIIIIIWGFILLHHCLSHWLHWLDVLMLLMNLMRNTSRLKLDIL